MAFNPTLDLGDLVKFGCLLLSGLWFVAKMSARLDLVTAKVDALKTVIAGQNEQLAEFSRALIQIARQDERLDALDRRLEDLRKGRGWVQRDVDGEYMKAGKVR